VTRILPASLGAKGVETVWRRDLIAAEGHRSLVVDIGTTFAATVRLSLSKSQERRPECVKMEKGVSNEQR
jgi:hypothetical protein